MDAANFAAWFRMSADLGGRGDFLKGALDGGGSGAVGKRRGYLNNRQCRLRPEGRAAPTRVRGVENSPAFHATQDGDDLAAFGGGLGRVAGPSTSRQS